MSDIDSSAVLKRAKYILGGIFGALLIGAVVVIVLRSFQAHALESSTALHKVWVEENESTSAHTVLIAEAVRLPVQFVVVAYVARDGVKPLHSYCEDSNTSVGANGLFGSNGTDSYLDEHASPKYITMDDTACPVHVEVA